MKIETLHVPLTKNQIEYVSFEEKVQTDKNKPAVLSICTLIPFDGLVMHTLNHYKAHLKAGYDSYIFISKDSELEKKLIQEKLPYYRFTQPNFLYKNSKIHKTGILRLISKIVYNYRQPGIDKLVKAIVTKHNIKVIHCNRHKDIHLLKKINDSDVKIILTRHSPSVIRTKYLKAFKTIFCVDQNCIDKIKAKCSKENIPTPKIKHLAPFFNEAESLNFDPSKTLPKEEFFKKEFGIDLPDYPNIVMVANLSSYKNHQLMFKAVHKLVHTKNKPINLLLCGQGYKENYLRTLAKQLKIEKYVHFLGFTYKRIEVMYHSDIKALTTKDEAFGIVLMEAALLKKPLLGPTKTGVVNTIKHKHTGVLFENGNVDDLVEKITFLIANPKLRKQYGENAYKHVKENFISDVLMKSVGDFYKEIM